MMAVVEIEAPSGEEHSRALVPGSAEELLRSRRGLRRHYMAELVLRTLRR